MRSDMHLRIEDGFLLKFLIANLHLDRFLDLMVVEESVSRLDLLLALLLDQELVHYRVLLE